MEYYVLGVILSALLLGAVVYERFAAAEWDATDFIAFREAELHLPIILDLIDSLDYQMYMAARYRMRKALFWKWSVSIIRDGFRAIVIKNLTIRSIGLLVLLAASTVLMQLKALIYCGRRDLRFLAGVELALIRSLT